MPAAWRWRRGVDVQGKRGDGNRPPYGQALVEVLLAAAIGVTLTAALAQLFIGSGRNQATTASQSVLQESARHALWFLRRSAQGAGYVGCGPDGNLGTGLNDDEPPPELALAPALSAFDGGDGRGRAWQPSLDALPTKSGAAPAFRSRNRLDPARLRPGTDVAVLRRVEFGQPLAVPMYANATPVATVDPDRALARADFAVVSTCRQAALFHVTGTTTSTGVTTLRHDAGYGLFANRANAGLLAAGWSYGGADGPAGARVGRPIVEIYFIGRRARDRGETPAWGLWRKAGVAAPAELVPGIDDMQLLLGIDAVPDDGDRTPQRYATPDAVGAADVRSLRVSVTATAPASMGGEPLPRRTFMQTMALRN